MNKNIRQGARAGPTDTSAGKEDKEEKKEREDSSDLQPLAESAADTTHVRTPSAGTAAKSSARTSSGSLWKEWLSFFLRAGIFVAVILVVFTQVLLLKRVEGNAMFPFLKDGDLTLCVRHPSDLQSGDIILYETTDGMRYGRILVMGEASVDIDGQGSVKVNGVPESGENVLFSTYDGGNLTYPYEVPAGSCFVLNDNRNESGDSRQYGAITKDQIRGRVVSFLRRRGI